MKFCSTSAITTLKKKMALYSSFGVFKVCGSPETQIHVQRHCFQSFFKAVIFTVAVKIKLERSEVGAGPLTELSKTWIRMLYGENVYFLKLFRNKFPSTSALLQDAATLFCCEAPEMFCGLKTKFPRLSHYHDCE